MPYPVEYCPVCGSHLEDYPEREAVDVKCTNSACHFSRIRFRLHHPFDLTITKPKVTNYSRAPGDSWSLSWIE